ncbi:MAG: autoinducer binding domain-containing protein [Sneathiella sp.]
MKIAEFIDASNAAPDNNSLFKAMEQFSSSLGFDRIAYGDLNGLKMENPKGLPEPAVLLNYAPDWIEHYIDRAYDKIDPVVQLTPGISAPYKWSRIGEQFKLSSDQKQLLDEAKDGGMHNGISVPILKFPQPGSGMGGMKLVWAKSLKKYRKTYLLDT